ncbi:MAG: hypothetical protein QM731_11230 [Chitinophagaceae bacterium]
MEKLLLRLLFLFRGLFKRQDVDVTQLFLIVQVKLLMDKRRVHVGWKRRNDEDGNSNKLWAAFLGYGFMGLFVAIAIGWFPLVLGMIIYHSYLLFMMALTLITDFSAVLLDTTDNLVILPRPVNSRTMFMARSLHIFIYLFQFTIVLAICPVVAIFIKYGFLTGLVGIVTSVLAVLLAVFLTYLLYLLIMRLSSEEKVKEVVTFFQIFMTIFFAVGFQLFPRLINLEEVSADFHLHWYSFILPPVWMALVLEAVHNLSFDNIHLLMVALAVGVPVITFWLLIKYFAPIFAAKLANVNQDSGGRKTKVIASKESKTLSERLSALFCQTHLEKAGFTLTWKITGRDKSFRMQFYPSLAYIAVFIFIFVFNRGQHLAEYWHNLPDTNKFLWLIYLPMFTILTSIALVSFNENFQAAWVYHCSPVQRPGEIVTGMLKAVFVKYFIPIYLVLFAFALYIWGIPVIDDFVFGFFNNLLCFFIMGSLSPKRLPFSCQPNVKEQSGRFITMIMQMILISTLVGLHFLIIKLNWWWVIYCLAVLFVVFSVLVIRNIQRTAWSKIQL